MIFISLGTQEFPMNRVLVEMDRLVGQGVVSGEVFAQTGHSSYVPANFKCEQFISMDLFHELIGKADLVIAHGGTGTIVSAIKAGKKVLAIPRLKKYGEHVDDHQIELVEMFSSKKYIKAIDDVSQLADAVRDMPLFIPEKYCSGNDRIKKIITDFITTIESKKRG